MGRTLSDDAALDCLTAAKARLPRSTVYLSFVLVAAVFTIRCDIVADARPASLDRSLEDRAETGRDPFALSTRHSACSSTGTYTRQEKCLVRIDIPDTGYDGLVEKKRLDRNASSATRTKEQFTRRT